MITTIPMAISEFREEGGEKMKEGSPPPEMICKCGHTHKFERQGGMPCAILTNSCPVKGCKCKEFKPTRESEIKFLAYEKKEVEEQLENINKRLRELMK